MRLFKRTESPHPRPGYVPLSRRSGCSLCSGVVPDAVATTAEMQIDLRKLRGLVDGAKTLRQAGNVLIIAGGAVCKYCQISASSSAQGLLVEGGAHAGEPELADRLIDGERRVAHAQPGMAALLQVRRGPAPVLLEKE